MSIAGYPDKSQTIRLALEHGFDMVGVASAAVARGPDWTRSVLVLAYATLDEAYDYNVYVALPEGRRWSKFAYEVVVARSATLALRLRDWGARAEPLLFEDSAAVINLRQAAVTAGLGVWGKNELVITQRFGPRVRLGAVFTDLDLAPDQPLREYFCSSCTRCWAACPSGALGARGLDLSRCLAEFQPSPDMLVRQKRETRQLTPYTRLQCSACVHACPIGARLAEPWWDGE
ncbi:MAG: 4Fe-4S double cluster binding domain-containing protein [Anaerolineae bacterium]